jgi:2',3'-cyclic-nucleotide 2'-phosphodiesterase (5'-nucleotidase family)
MRRIVCLALAVSGCARPPASPPAAAAPDTVTVLVAGTTDVHGWLRGWDYFANRADTSRGLSRAASVVDSLRRTHVGPFVLVDAGDDLQGTALNNVALRDSLLPNPVMAAMNAMQYDAAVIGNHEFNFGLGYLNRVIAQARFPMLAANVFRTDGSRAYRSWVMLEKGGVRIAIVGATTPGSMVWDRDKLVGRVEVRDILPSVQAAVTEAREQRADVVIVVLHSGLGGGDSYDAAATGVASENVTARVAREVAGIDLIVFGHSHRELADSTINGVLLTQPRNGAGSVSTSRLTLARSGGGWRVVARRGGVVRTAGRPEAASVVTATNSAHERAIAYATSPVGSTAVTWRSDSARVRDMAITDLVLEVQRRVAGTDLSSNAAYTLNAEFGPGAITMADLAELYPYENNVLRAVRITGRQLRDYLEFSARYFRYGAPLDSLVDPAIPGFNFDVVSGVEYVIDISRPIGARITKLERNGMPVQDTDTFTMALNDYRQSGGGGYTMLRGAPLVYDRQEIIRDLLVEEVRRRGTIRPEDYHTVNWRIVPDSLAAAAYRSMRRLPYDRPRVAPAARP